MIRSIIKFSAYNRFLVIFITLFVTMAGVYSLKNIPIDAIPDLSDTQVIIYSKWDRSPEIIEKQLTYPLVTSLLGAPKIKTIRAFSDYGYSYVYLIFEDNTDLYWARSRVLEYLSQITPKLPSDVEVELGPDATSVGWIFQYALVDEEKKYDLSFLRSLQDWNIKFRLQSIKGVSEVASLGGQVKEIQVKVDLRKLELYKISFSDVISAVKDSNNEASGRVLEFSGAEAMIKSSGLVSNLTEIENSIVSYPENANAPVLVKDVATVSFGGAQRRGVSDFNGEGDAVSGTIVMRQGEDVTTVIKNVKNELEKIKETLPAGIKIETVYDRSSLIFKTIDTLKHTLIEELIIVSLVILIFLWHLPSAIVPIITIPVAIIISFIPLYLLGYTANIMLLSGIAISIGVIVDGAIIEVENAYRKIQKWEEGGKKENFFEVRLNALLEVGPSVFFSLLVIAVAFIPIFTLIDQEGRLFKPLAVSKNLTMGIAALLAITLDPAMRMLFSRSENFQGKSSFINKISNSLFVGKYYSEEKHPITRILFKIYKPSLHFVLHFKKTFLLIAFLLTLSIFPAINKLGSEFMPTLHEGTILYMPTALPGISASEAERILTLQNNIIKTFPEVETVYGKAGKADTSTDTAPLSMIETVIALKDEKEWRKKDRFYSKFPNFTKPLFRFFVSDNLTYEELINEMDEKLSFIGMPNIWTMPIKNRIDMLSTGITSPVGIKVFGNNLNKIEEIALDIEKKLKGFHGIRNVIAERATRGFYLDIDFDRSKLKHFGLSLKEAQEQALGAIGGVEVTNYFQERERYSIQVRMANDYRDDLESIKKFHLHSPLGSQILLETIATVKISEGPSMIRSENASLVSHVFIDLDLTKTDMGSFLQKAKDHLKNNVSLPTGYSLKWSGQFENMERVKERLTIVIPFTLIIILFLIYFNTKSLVKTGIILLAIPFSLIGAFWFLVYLDYNISIATWVGMIALLGLDAETGIFMLLYLDLAYNDKKEQGGIKTEKDLHDVVIEGAVHRIRPKLMTIMALFMGLIPIMWSTGSGSDVMRRIAAPMIGGLATSFILELFIYPILFYIWKKNIYFRRIL